MTRFPKGKKGSKWTIKELDAVKAEWKGDTLNDGGGLTGEVRVNSENVSIVFRFAFKWQGKVTWHYCGAYPLGQTRVTRILGRKDTKFLFSMEGLTTSRTFRQSVISATSPRMRAG